MPITNEQIQAIKDKVDKLVADKTDADAKTQASNSADTAAGQANAVAAQAKLDEAAADALAATDLQDLVSFVDGLVTPATPPPSA